MGMKAPEFSKILKQSGFTAIKIGKDYIYKFKITGRMHKPPTMELIMSCNMHCNKFLSYIALGFSIILSDKKILSVTVFNDPLKEVKNRIRLTRRYFKRCHGAQRYGDIVVSIGKPNYREREFLKKCKMVGCKPRRYWINRVEPEKKVKKERWQDKVHRETCL